MDNINWLYKFSVGKFPTVSEESVDIKENDNIQSVLDNSRNILHTNDVTGLSKSDDITKDNFEVPGWSPEVSFNVTHYVDLDSLNTSLIVPTLREPISSKSKQKGSSRYSQNFLNPNW